VVWLQTKNLKKCILVFVITSTLLAITLCANFSYSEDQDLEIIAYRGLNSEIYYLVFGEIYNRKKNAVTDVIIEFNLLSSDGNLIDKINATSMLKVVPSKRRSPFVGYSFKSKSERDTITNVTISRIFFTDTEEMPKALALVRYYYENGTFTTHILNNSTLVLGVENRKPTNNFMVVATLYYGAKVVGVCSQPLVLADPGLLWDEDTSSDRLGGMPPVIIEFTAPFTEDEVMKADKIIASVESKDFSGQYVLIGCKKENEWTWTTLSEEENPLSTVSSGGNNNFASLATLLSLAILSVFAVIILKRRKHK
jgi:hypothetical protein